MVARWIGVFGTHGWTADPRRAWTHRDSVFSSFMRTKGFDHARPERPYVWSGDLDGLPVLAGGNDWEAGAEAFLDYVDRVPLDHRNVIAHSHGGQVVLLAAARGLQLRSLVLVATPVRKAIERDVAPIAVRNIGRCLHLSDARWDFLGFAGAVLDGRFSLRRTFEVDGIESRTVKGVGHSGLLYDVNLFPRWEEQGWLQVLAGVPVART